MRDWNNKLIKKAIKHYEYFKAIKDCTNSFIEEYDFFAKKENLKKHINVIWTTLGGCPYSTHIAAKHLLFQENSECWKYFERTALFWTMSHINDPWLDNMKAVLEYSLYVERIDLIELLLKKADEYIEKYKTEKDYIKQKVYPSTQLVHFLIEKWLGGNSVKNRVLKFGTGYGIYQNLIDNWDDLSVVDSNYWDELCEYHLNGIGLNKGDDYDAEEFLACGLVPMELINIIQVRKRLNLDIPQINHELFQTPMAKIPLIPTGYQEAKDVKYQLVKRTIDTKTKWSYDEIIAQLKSEFSESSDLFF